MKLLHHIRLPALALAARAVLLQGDVAVTPSGISNVEVAWALEQ